MNLNKELPRSSFRFRKSTERKSGCSLVNSISTTKELCKTFTFGEDTVILTLKHGIPHINIIDSKEAVNGDTIEEHSNINSNKTSLEAKKKLGSADTRRENKNSGNGKTRLLDHKHKLQNNETKSNQSKRKKVSKINSDKKSLEAKKILGSADTGRKNKNPENGKNPLDHKLKLQNNKTISNQSKRRKVSKRK